MIIKQIHLINIEQTTVDVREESRLEAAQPLGDGVLKVERANDAILGGRDGQLNEAGGAAESRERFASGIAALTRDAEARRAVGLTRVGAIGDHGNRGQQTGEATHRR